MGRQKAEHILIRSAQKPDANKIVQLQLDSIKYLSIKDYTPLQLQALLDSKKYPRGSNENILVAEINSQIVGFASLRKYRNFISAIFVDPNFVRRGIGTKLLQAIEKEAKQNGIRVLWVYSSLTGHAFYQANGYETIRNAEISYSVTVPIPCIQMKKRLSSSSHREQKFDSFYKFFVCFVLIVFLIYIFF